MGFAQGLRAGSDAAERAFNTYYATKDRRTRDEQEAQIKAELAKLDTPQQALVMPKAEFTAEGAPGLGGFDIGAQPMGAARGLQLSSMPQGGPPATGFDAGNVAPTPRAPSALDREAVYGNIARIKGDVAGMRASDQNQTALRIKDAFSRYMKEFDADNEGQVDMAIRQLNTTDGVVTVGDQDSKGYRSLSFVDADGRGKFTKLTRAEQAQLYAAGQMMAEYPDEAMARIAAINKDLADSLAKRNSTVTGVTSANNQANNLRNDDIRGDATLAENVRSNQVREGLARATLASQDRARKEAAARSAHIGEYVDRNGNTVLLDLGAAPRGPGGVLQIPDGLMPKNARQSVSPEARVKMIAEYATQNGVSAGEAALAVDSIISMGSAAAPASLAAPDLVELNKRATQTGQARPAVQAAPAQAAPRPALTLRQAQEMANQASRPAPNLRGLVLEDFGQPTQQNPFPYLAR